MMDLIAARSDNRQTPASPALGSGPVPRSLPPTLGLVLLLAAAAGRADPLAGEEGAPDVGPVGSAAAEPGAEGEETFLSYSYDDEAAGDATELDPWDADAPAAEGPAADGVAGEARATDDRSGEELATFQGDEVVVTGTRTRRRRSQSSQATSVVTTTDIRRSQPVGVGEAVEEVPGVQVVPRGPVLVNPSIRGFSGNRVVLLVDGVRVASSRTMGVTGSFLDVNDVRRIEVVRGPTSMMYGTDALGGTINILTTDGFDDAGFGGRYGLLAATNNGELANTLGLHYGDEAFFVRAYGQVRDAGDYLAGDGEEVGATFYHDRSVGGEVGLRFGEHTVTLSEQSYFGRGVGKIATQQDLDRHRRIWFPADDNHRLTARYDVERDGVLARYHASVVADWADRQQQTDTYAVDWARRISETDKAGDYLHLEGQTYLTLQLVERNALTMGLSATGSFWDSTVSGFGIRPDGTRTDVVTTPEFRDARSFAFGVFAQDEWDIVDALRLVLGLRYDDLQTWGSLGEGEEAASHDYAVSGSLGLVLRPTDGLSITANAGRAFRGANIREKYYYGTTSLGFCCGNPEVQPETSWNVDLGARVDIGPLVLEGYGFAAIVDDLITLVAPAEESECDLVYENTQNALLVGGEVEASLMLRALAGNAFSLRPFFSLSFVRGEDLDTHGALPQIAPVSLRGGLRAFGSADGILSYTLEIRVRGDLAQERVAAEEPATDGFVLLDLVAELAFP
ncbi:MAG: TonB-dependent receptor, partial [Deltaproteobacteria bacterium]|nr:TonB-dependent receptor [Deltaproteobacteria bacterium]